MRKFLQFIWGSIVIQYREWMSFWRAYIISLIDRRRIKRAFKLARAWNKNDGKTYYIIRDHNRKPICVNNFGIKNLKRMGHMPKNYQIDKILEYSLGIVTNNDNLLKKYDEVQKRKREKEYV